MTNINCVHVYKVYQKQAQVYNKLRYKTDQPTVHQNDRPSNRQTKATHRSSLPELENFSGPMSYENPCLYHFEYKLSRAI